MWKSTYLLLLLYFQNVFAVWDGDVQCPQVCICRLDHLTDMSIYKHIEPKNLYNRQTEHEDEMNDVILDEPIEAEHNVILRYSTCILQTETDVSSLIEELPKDLEALTLIQGFESGNKTLKFSKLVNHTELKILELQGTISKQQNASIFFWELDETLPGLKYLNLDKVMKKEMNPDESDEVVTVVYLHKNTSHPLKLKTVEKKDILPYDQYFELQRRESKRLFFEGFKNLKLLIVKECELNKIEWEMFEGLSSLTHLILEKNNISKLPEFAFYGTPNLKVLSLARNKLINIQITDLAGLFYLEYLDLSQNNFSHLSELSLPPFPKLKLANFRDNPISVIFPNTFEIMNQTESLILGGPDTPLSLIPNSLQGLKMLKKLFLYNLHISTLTKEYLVGMPQLEELIFEDGNIPHIQFDAFTEVFNIQKLSLKSCNLQNVSMDSFIALSNLKVLDLSRNHLKYLPLGVFDGLKSLQELYLNNNNFTKLPRDIFNGIKPKLIRLNQNPWHCSCEMANWKPIYINKIKQKSSKVCDLRHDKGVGCLIDDSPLFKYVYDNRVAPICAAPRKFKNRIVFHVMRGQLRCPEFKPKLKKSKVGMAQKYLNTMGNIEKVGKKMQDNGEDETLDNRGSEDNLNQDKVNMYRDKQNMHRDKQNIHQDKVDIHQANVHLHQVNMHQDGSQTHQNNINTINMHGDNISKVNMNQVNMTKVNLNQVDINQVDINQADMNQVDMNQVDMNQVDMNQDDMNKVNMIDENIPQNNIIQNQIQSKIPKLEDSMNLDNTNQYNTKHFKLANTNQNKYREYKPNRKPINEDKPEKISLFHIDDDNNEESNDLNSLVQSDSKATHQTKLDLKYDNQLLVDKPMNLKKFKKKSLRFRTLTV